MGRDARSRFLFARHSVEFGALVFHERSVFSREGAEDEEWISRAVRRPGGAIAESAGEELLEAALESIEVVAEDKAGGAVEGIVVAKINGRVDGRRAGKSDHKL